MSENHESPIERNLRKMHGPDNEMHQLLMQESIGGNAGTYNGKSCYAANFHYNSETGEIQRFTNEPENGRGLHWGTLRLIASDPSLIINLCTDRKSSRLARAVLGLTVTRYNELAQKNTTNQ